METLRDYISSQREIIRTQLIKLVASPSVHGIEETKQACIDAAQAITDMYAELGIKLEAYYTVDGSIALSDFVPGSLESTRIVLLYPHYGIQPVGDKPVWTADSRTLGECDDRWYGRGAIDCKGNVVIHLAALRALCDDAFVGRVDVPNIKPIVKGSEERGPAGLNNLIATQLELSDADVILIADVGNIEVDQPTFVTILRGTTDVEVRVGALEQSVHLGMFGGVTPNVLTALIRTLDSLCGKNGLIPIDDLNCSQRWESLDYTPGTFRTDAGVLDGVDLVSNKDASVSGLTWTRPSVIMTGADCPPVANTVNAVPSTAMMHVNFRILGDVDPVEAQGALGNHPHAHTPWGMKVTVERDGLANPFRANVKDKVVQLVADSLPVVYSKETASMGEGASIPLCITLLKAVSGVDIALYGVEKPQAHIHSADESMGPNEIRDIVIGEVVFLVSVSGT